VFISGKDVLQGAGGHESYVRAHARAAARLGFTPHILCIGRRAHRVETDFGVVHHIASRGPQAAQIPALARAAMRFFTAQPAGTRCILHGFAIWSAAAALAGQRLRRRGFEVLVVANAYATRAYELAGAWQGGFDRLPWLRRIRQGARLGWVRMVDDRIEGWGYAHANALLVNYASVERILTSAYGQLSARRVPYTSEDAFLNGAATAPDVLPGIDRLNSGEGPLIVAISRQSPRKGINILLMSLADLAKKGIAFRACLVGPGRLLEDHRRLSRELGLDDRVAIPGRVDDPRVYLSRADVFVLPSLVEGSGSVSVIEALRSGTAIVASACDGIPEDLTDGHDALLVAPGDSAALSTALGRMLVDPALRHRLAQNGFATFERRFSPDRFVAALAEVYGAPPTVEPPASRPRVAAPR
jgi:glycosyltransferase involved in cell wall biosynthesis